MTFDELLNEEFFDVMCEASISTLNKRRKRKLAKKNIKEVDPEERVDNPPNEDGSKKKKGKHKDSAWEEGNPKFRSGRERLVAAVVHLVSANGGSVSNSDVRDYVYERYKQWGNGDPEAAWIDRLEKKAISLGFNPRSYKNQKKGDSIGKGAKGDPEYDGRAAFYTGVMNGFANHFLKKQGKTLKTRFPGRLAK